MLAANRRCSAQLQINKMMPVHGQAGKRTEIIILCSKVRENHTSVRIRDMSYVLDAPESGSARQKEQVINGWRRDPSTGYWEITVTSICTTPATRRRRIHPPRQPALTRTVCLSCAPHADVHHQFAVVFTMPPYHNPNITNSVEVMVALVDTQDQTDSPKFPFTYTPTGTSSLVGGR